MAHVELSKQFDLDTVVTLKVGNAIVASSTTTTGTPYISMRKAHFIAFIVTSIDTTLAGIITAKVISATATGAGLNTTTTLASTTFATGTGSAGVAKILEVDASELDVANGYDHVALQLTTNGADSVACSIIRGPLRYEPAGYV